MIRSLTAWLHDLAVAALELHRRTARHHRVALCHCGAAAGRWPQCNPCRNRYHPSCWCSIRPSLGDDLHNRT